MPTQTGIQQVKPGERLETIGELRPILMDMTECVVLDIETTGFSLEKHAEIIEIGAVKLDVVQKKMTGKFKTFVQPAYAFTIPAKITDLTEITWDNVKDAPYIEQVLPELARFIGDLPVVAHNATFDWIRFLVPAFRIAGLHATNHCICSMRLAKEVLPNRGKNGYNLASLCDLYEYKIEGHHDALVDAITTAGLFARLLDEYRVREENLPIGGKSGEFEGELLEYPVPSSIPRVNFNNMKVFRVSMYEGASKKDGPRIYVSTSFGRLYYSVRRNVWSCVDIWVDDNAPVELWGRYVLHKMGLSLTEFVDKYVVNEAS